MDSKRTSAPGDPSYEPYRHINNPEPYHDRSEPYDRSEPRQSFDYAPAGIKIRSYTFNRIKAMRDNRVHVGRVVLRALSAAASLAVVGVLADTLVVYTASQNSRLLGDHGQPLNAWPVSGVDALPVYLMLGAGGIAALFNILGLLFLIGPLGRISARSIGITFAFLSHAVAIAAWVVAIVYSKTDYPHIFARGCSYGAYEQQMKNNAIGLQQMCIEMTSAFAAGVSIAFLEACNAVVLLLSLRSRSRNGKGKAKASYRPREYQKLDETAAGQDVPMLDAPRGSMM